MRSGLCASVLLVGLLWGSLAQGQQPRPAPPQAPNTPPPTGQEIELPTDTVVEAPLPKPSAAQLRQLAGGLASENFSIRERSQAALSKYASQHPETLKKALAKDYVDSLDPEVRYRLAEVIYEAVVEDMEHSGFLGIIMQSADVQVAGRVKSSIAVARVLPNSAAARAGLRVGDQIIQVDDLTFSPSAPLVRQQVRVAGQTSPNLTKFKNYIGGRKKGTEVTLQVQRSGAGVVKIPVQLGRRTRDLMEPQELKAEDQFFEKWLQEQAGREEVAPPEGK